jgi:hypothetical protein
VTDKPLGLWEDRSFLEFCDAKVAGLFRYWDAKRGTRDMPERRDIDPLEMRPWLGRVVLYDVVEEPPDFRYRLFGSEIAERLGRDLTGRLVSETSITEDNARTGSRLAEIVTRRTFRYRNDQMLASTGSFVGTERLFLPFGPGDRVTMLLLYFHSVRMIY